MSFSEIVRKGPTAVAVLFQDARQPVGQDNASELAWVCGQLARKEADRPLAIEWAEVAILADERSTSPNRDSEMSLRVALVNRFGPDESQEVLSLQTILDWLGAVFDSPLTASEALAKGQVDPQNVAHLRTLRDLKNRIGVVRHLAPELQLNAPKLESWLKLFDRLP